MNKTTSIILVLIIVLAVGGFVYVKNKKSINLDTSNNQNQISEQENETEEEDDNTPKFEDGTVPSVNNTGNTSGSGANDASYVYYTLAEVSTHNSASSCWAAVNGKVYDLTSWIGKHPGGPEAIKSICGKDGSAAFNGQHNGQENPAAALASFRIGVLK